MYDVEGLEERDQMNFVRKVYSILTCQLAFTVAFILWVQTDENLRIWVNKNSGWSIAAGVMAIVFMFMIVCCFSRKVPLNYILMAAFTLCEGYLVGAVTATYPKDVVAMAGGATALTTLALTIYAMRTKTSIEVFVAMAFVVYLAMMPLIIISWFVGLGALNTVYCCLGVVLYGLYLIIDTMMIVRGKGLGGRGCMMDEYCVGALLLYMDIIGMFLYLLRLFGNSR